MKRIYHLLYNRFARKLKADIAANPQQAGVFHKDGCVYATNGHHAVKLPAEYPAELEGLVIDKAGEKIGGAFPNMDRIIPNWTQTKHIQVDLKKLEEAARKVQRVNVKTIRGTNYANIEVDEEETLYIPASTVVSIFDLFKALKEDFQFRSYYLHQIEMTQLVVISENYLFDEVFATVVVMPVIVPDDLSAEDVAYPYFTIDEALAYKKEVKPTNKAWYE